MHICNVRSQVFFPGVWVCLRDFILFLFFLAALSANLHCGKTLGLETCFEHGKVFQEYGWETRTFERGEKESTFDGGGLRQAHTHWEGRKPFIQTFELCFYGSMFALWFHCMLYFCKKKLVNYDFISCLMICFNDLFYAVFFGLFHIVCYSLWYLIFFACVL